MSKQAWWAAVVSGVVCAAVTLVAVWAVGVVEDWRYQRSKANA